MIFPARIFGEETLDEKSKFIRFERLSELFTYVALIPASFLTILPFNYSFDRTLAYIFIFLILSFSFFWFRLVPKKFSGKLKNISYYTISILFTSFVIYFTQGIESPIIFLFYLTCLAVAASMGKKETLFFAAFSSVSIFTLAIVGSGNLPLSQSISLALLHIWGLITTIVFGWLIFGVERKAFVVRQKLHIDQVQKANQIRDEFVFIISSKLVGPIVTLKGYITLILSGKFGELDSDQKDIIIKTKENSKRLELLVGDMLDLSKIETGELRLDLEKVDIGRLVSGTLSDFSLKSLDKKISLLFDNPKEAIFVLADSTRVHEVIGNLVDNAIKYSSVGSIIKVYIQVEGDSVIVNVKDRGEGISREGQKHLFEKFYRVNSENIKVMGSGLGLFISKQLIDMQGGRIWCKSKIDQGSTFSFQLPKYKNE